MLNCHHFLLEQKIWRETELGEAFTLRVLNGLMPYIIFNNCV